MPEVYGMCKRSLNNLTNVKKPKPTELCFCFAEVYENGEDENPILNRGELQHFTQRCAEIHKRVTLLLTKTPRILYRCRFKCQPV